MKTVSLEEGLRMATKGPLELSENGGCIWGNVDIYPYEHPMALCSPSANRLGAEDQILHWQKADMALLRHCFNLFPEVVELCSDLLDYISEDESTRAIGLRRDGATIMAKAETI
jgi:hypothetical protein